MAVSNEVVSARTAAAVAVVGSTAVAYVAVYVPVISAGGGGVVGGGVVGEGGGDSGAAMKAPEPEPKSPVSAGGDGEGGGGEGGGVVGAGGVVGGGVVGAGGVVGDGGVVGEVGGVVGGGVVGEDGVVGGGVEGENAPDEASTIPEPEPEPVSSPEPEPEPDPTSARILPSSTVRASGLRASMGSSCSSIARSEHTTTPKSTDPARSATVVLRCILKAPRRPPLPDAVLGFDLTRFFWAPFLAFGKVAALENLAVRSRNRVTLRISRRWRRASRTRAAPQQRSAAWWLLKTRSRAALGGFG